MVAFEWCFVVWGADYLADVVGFEPTAASYILLVLACLVLVARRLRPVEVLGAELVLSLVGIAVDHSNSQTFGALFVAVYTVSMLRAWREAVGASAVVGLLICGSLWVVAADEVEKQVVYVFAALIAAARAVGIARRARGGGLQPWLSVHLQKKWNRCSHSSMRSSQGSFSRKM